MATELLFRKNPYLKEFSCKVISCQKGKNGFEVVLDKTAFYPEGGGQPADFGFLGNAKVTDVHEKDGIVTHLCSEALEEGSTQEGKIDWERRFDHMQHHSAEHIVSGLVNAKYGYDNVGFHMGSIVTVDFNGPLTEEEVKEIEHKANDIVYQNYEVTESYPSDEELKALKYRSKKELTGEVRIVTIPGADTCACCGTHVKRTGEVGTIKLSNLTKYKGGVRLTVTAGRKAVLDYDKKEDINVEISRLLSAKPMEIAEAVEAKCKETEKLKLKIKELENARFEMISDEYKGRSEALFLSEELDAVEIKELCLKLIKKMTGTVMIFAKGEKAPYKFILGKAEGDLRNESKEFLKSLNAKGGGAPNLLQGVINSDEETARDLFLKTF